MLAIRYTEEKGNQMVSASIPKHGFSSPGCNGIRLPKHCFHRVACQQWVAVEIGNPSIPRIEPFPFMKMPKKRLGLVIFSVFFWSGHLAMALSPNGDWRISGTVTDIRFNMSGTARTNTLSVGGACQSDQFLVTVTPINTEDEIAETVGWDGHKLRLIQRYPETPGKGLARDQILGYVEPTVFSRYATHSTAGVLLAFADGKSLTYLQALEEPIILGDLRAFPEEDNKYDVKISPDGSVNIVALSPGREVTPSGDVPVTGFMDGFRRWVFASKLVPLAGQRDFQLLFEY